MPKHGDRRGIPGDRKDAGQEKGLDKHFFAPF
jgi:hypothetical protein